MTHRKRACLWEATVVSRRLQASSIWVRGGAGALAKHASSLINSSAPTAAWPCPAGHTAHLLWRRRERPSSVVGVSTASLGSATRRTGCA